MLDGAKNVCETCAKCNIIKYRLFPEDILNDDAERLKTYYNLNKYEQAVPHLFQRREKFSLQAEFWQ